LLTFPLGTAVIIAMTSPWLSMIPPAVALLFFHLLYLLLWWACVTVSSKRALLAVIGVHAVFTIANTIGYIVCMPLVLDAMLH
jgi:hypothetical protein